MPVITGPLLRLNHVSVALDVFQCFSTVQSVPIANGHVLVDQKRHKHLQEYLRIQSAALHAASNSVVITSSDGVVEWVNPAFSILTGYSLDEAVGKTPGQLLGSGKQSRRYYERMWQTILAGGVWRGEIINRRKDGTLYTEVQSISPVTDDNGNITHFVAIKQDITEYKEMKDRLEALAYYDTLTGLPNRSLLVEHLTFALTEAGKNGNRLAVLYLDLDHLKMINDTFGYGTGDEVIKAAADRIRACVDPEDRVARVAGDEFVILVPGIADADEATRIATSIQEAFSHPLTIRHSKRSKVPPAFPLSVSIGASIYPDDASEAGTLMQNADAAMYVAKEWGRPGLRFFSKELRIEAHQRLSLYNALHEAVNHEQFTLAYQPLIDLERGSVVGCEALLRWDRPGKGRMPPDQFIPMLEETMMIVPVGEWVVREACACLRSLHDAEHPLARITVNVSTHQLSRREFIDTVAEALSANGLQPGQLEIELTESTLMANVEAHSSTLSALRDLGVRVSVDDFGTGYSSLSYLKRLPLDTVKIDRSFVRDIHNDPHDAAIVRAIRSLAQALELEVIAEGIENDEQLAFLRQQHCELGQGYLFSPPLDYDDLVEFLNNPAQSLQS